MLLKRRPHSCNLSLVSNSTLRGRMEQSAAKLAISGVSTRCVQYCYWAVIQQGCRYSPIVRATLLLLEPGMPAIGRGKAGLQTKILKQEHPHTPPTNKVSLRGISRRNQDESGNSSCASNTAPIALEALPSSTEPSTVNLGKPHSSKGGETKRPRAASTKPAIWESALGDLH